MKKEIFKGTCTALVTPFDKNGKIDYESTKKLINFQLKNKIDAILILGSTGESFSISQEEKQNFIIFVKKLIKNQAKLIVGSDFNTPKATIEYINKLKSFGADAVLVPTPFFNRCTQNGIFEYFKTIDKNIDMPMIIYNIPTRSGVNVEPKTMLNLCQLKNVVGLKEANGNIYHILKMFHEVGDKIPIYCGNDNLYQLFLSLKCSGIISVASNAFPNEICSMWNNKNNSLNIHNKFFNFNNLIFCEPNPIPIKYVLTKLNLIENVLRLPLTQLESKNQALLDEELKNLGVEI